MGDELRTERLVLRRAGYADAIAMHAIMSNPVAMRFWSTPPHGALEETERWMASMVDAEPAASDDFIVTLDGALIGKLGCWRLPEIGFLIDPAHWGRGYASEALGAFLKRRRSLGSTEIIADTDPENLGSIRLLKKHGFVESGRAERTFEIAGEWHDSIYWRLEL